MDKYYHQKENRPETKSPQKGKKDKKEKRKKTWTGTRD
jgi:hypothetical protein